MKQLSILLTLTICLLFGSCRTSTSTAYATFETECLGSELDGSITLRAWGKGNTGSDAREQAMKNAVRDIVFRGITAGSNECNYRPLIAEPNAQEKYEAYFSKFFRDGGEYEKYVNLADERHYSRIKMRNKTQKNYGITVRVLRADLKAHLIADGIIK